jgi:hypothetical protein
MRDSNIGQQIPSYSVGDAEIGEKLGGPSLGSGSYQAPGVGARFLGVMQHWVDHGSLMGQALRSADSGSGFVKPGLGALAFVQLERSAE